MATIGAIQSLLSYAPEFAKSGSGLKWSTGPRVNLMAGSLDTESGSYRIWIDGIGYKAHHIVAMLAGVKDWQKPRRHPGLFLLLHRNGDKQDNRPSNLLVVPRRACPESETCKQLSLPF